MTPTEGQKHPANTMPLDRVSESNTARSGLSFDSTDDASVSKSIEDGNTNEEEKKCFDAGEKIMACRLFLANSILANILQAPKAIRPRLAESSLPT